MWECFRKLLNHLLRYLCIFRPYYLNFCHSCMYMYVPVICINVVLIFAKDKRVKWRGNHGDTNSRKIRTYENGVLNTLHIELKNALTQYKFISWVWAVTTFKLTVHIIRIWRFVVSLKILILWKTVFSTIEDCNNRNFSLSKTVPIIFTVQITLKQQMSDERKIPEVIV